MAGTPTWPGATLEKVTTGAADPEAGVQFDRIHDKPGQPGGPVGSMLSRPAGCAALTDVIARSAQRGPRSATKYAVSYDGVRIVMTDAVRRWTSSSWRHGEPLREVRVLRPEPEGIPITTTRPRHRARGAGLPADDAPRVPSAFMAFQNVGALSTFGIAFPTADPAIISKRHCRRRSGRRRQTGSQIWASDKRPETARNAARKAALQ